MKTEKPPKPILFFRRLFHLAPPVFSALLVALTVLTVLSRLGVLSLAGVAVVVSDSMEPAIRRFDLVVYVSANYTAGDVVVYCPTPSHCYVHRVVDFILLDTVDGNATVVVTKGDNANETDSPVHTGLVRGKVVLVVPRELWIPLLIVFVAYSLYSFARQPVTGLSYSVLFAVGLSSLLATYAVVPQPVEPTPVRPIYVNLAGVYLDPASCTISVQYTGDLALTSVNARVGGTTAGVLAIYEKEVVLKPDPELLTRAFETGSPLVIWVNATLNHIGLLEGEYELVVGGHNPEVASLSGKLLVRNPNCFPMKLYVSVKYYDGGEWRWSNTTYVVDGFSYITVEPSEGVKHAYVYIRWFNQGEERWIGIQVNTVR